MPTSSGTTRVHQPGGPGAGTERQQCCQLGRYRQPTGPPQASVGSVSTDHQGQTAPAASRVWHRDAAGIRAEPLAQESSSNETVPLMPAS
jgi:hypothetical protein